MYRGGPIKLCDCQVHGAGSGAELFVVEGDSASKSVVRARDSRFQAVLPMQGKPLNALKATKPVVARNALFQTLITSLGGGWGDSFQLDQVRYDRLILLFDPDADGIHCGALMVMFFYRWMRPLLDSGRLNLIRPPQFEVRSSSTADRLHAYGETQYRNLCSALDDRGLDYQGQRFRGLASMDASTLITTCLDPQTRNMLRLGADDAEAAIRVFAPNI